MPERKLLLPDAAGGCEFVTNAVVNDLPEVKAAFAALQEEVRSGAGPIGGFGPQDDGRGGFVVSVGFNSPGFFDGRIYYTVDRDGALHVDVQGTPVVVPEQQAWRVQEACAHRRPHR